MIEIKMAIIVHWVFTVLCSLFSFVFTFALFMLADFGNDDSIKPACWTATVVAIITFLIAGKIVVFV